MCYLRLKLCRFGGKNAGILYEVQKEGGGEDPEGNYDEEWPSGNPGRMPSLWDKSVQNR